MNKKLDTILKWITLAEVGIYVSPAAAVAATAVEVGAKVWKVIRDSKKK